MNGSTATGVNDLGVVIGDAQAPITTAQLYLSGGVYTPIISGFNGSGVNGINNAGDIVGSYSDSHVHGIGFLIHAGVTTRDPGPGRRLHVRQWDQQLGDDRGGLHHGLGASGFFLSGGVFTTIQVPGSAAMEIYGINDPA